MKIDCKGGLFAGAEDGFRPSAGSKPLRQWRRSYPRQARPLQSLFYHGAKRERGRTVVDFTLESGSDKQISKYLDFPAEGHS